MKRTLAATALVALLVLAPATPAKEITRAEVCGADGCTAVDDEGDRALLVNGGPPRTPPAAAPFYLARLEVDTGGSHVERLYVAAVPDRRALRGADGTWMEMPEDLTAVIERYARGHRPRPAGRLAGAAPAAPPPARATATADGKLPWPEGALLGLALLGVAGLVARRVARGGRRFGPASG